MTHKVSSAVSGFLDALYQRPDRHVSFAPFIYLALFIAILIAISSPGPPLAVDPIVGASGHWVWAVTGLLAGPIWLLGTFLIFRRTGTARYRGFWLRSLADVMLATVLWTFLFLRLASVGGLHHQPDDEAVIGLMIIFSTALYSTTLIVRDVWTMFRITVMSARKDGDNA